jgi:hypothetical protein
MLDDIATRRSRCDRLHIGSIQPMVAECRISKGGVRVCGFTPIGGLVGGKDVADADWGHLRYLLKPVHGKQILLII